jgi:predicted amidohydrolase
MPKTLADLFLELWLTLTANEAAFREALDWQENNPADTLGWASELDTILARDGWAVPAGLAGWRAAGSGKLRPPGDIARVLFIAQAIDRWHQPLSDPHELPFSHARASRQLRRLSRLNDDGSRWRVILRRPLWGRYSDRNMPVPDAGRGPWDTFANLFVMPTTVEASDPDDKTKKRTISLSYRLFDSTELRLPIPHEDWKPRIGFVPLAEEAGDIDLRRFEDEDGHWYDAQVQELGRRAAKAIAELCAADAEIIVFPEMVLFGAAVGAIQQAVKQHGPQSRLRLVVAGTRRTLDDVPTTPPFNEAIVLDHTGQEIGRQRKLHRWNLDGELCERYDVPLPPITLPSGAYVREYITPGEEVTVLDSPFGRLAVMICEDLGRSEPGRWLRSNILLDWLFTPILDGSVERGRWMVKAGGKAAVLERCRVVVANSVPLTHRLNAVNGRTQKWPQKLECGVALCLDFEAGKARYHVENHKLSAAADAHYLIDWDPLGWKDSASLKELEAK